MNLWISIGGGIGAMARFGLSGWVTTWAHAGFPWGTFVVNVTGSTVLGFAHGALSTRPGSSRARAFLTTGLCGGFTTFSTFDFEILALLADGHYSTAVSYAAASVLVCVAGVAAGLRLAGRVRPPSTAAAPGASAG
jgi:fluoride exporter